MKLLKQTLIATAVTAVMASSAAFADWHSGPAVSTNIFSSTWYSPVDGANDLSYLLGSTQGLLAGDRIIINLTNGAKFRVFPTVIVYGAAPGGSVEPISSITTGAGTQGHFSLERGGAGYSYVVLRALDPSPGNTRIAINGTDTTINAPVATGATAAPGLFDVSGVTLGTDVDINITTVNSGAQIITTSGTAEVVNGDTSGNGGVIGGIYKIGYKGSTLSTSWSGYCKTSMTAPGACGYTDVDAPGAPYLFSKKELYSCTGTTSDPVTDVAKVITQFKNFGNPIASDSTTIGYPTIGRTISHTLTYNDPTVPVVNPATSTTQQGGLLYTLTSNDTSNGFAGIKSIDAGTLATVGGTTTFTPGFLTGSTANGLISTAAAPTAIVGVAQYPSGANAAGFTYDPTTKAAYAVNTAPIPAIAGGSVFSIPSIRFTLDGTTAQAPRSFTLTVSRLDNSSSVTTVGGRPYISVACSSNPVYNIKRDGSSFTMNAFGPKNTLKISDVSGSGPSKVTFKAYDATGLALNPVNPMASMNPPAGTTGVYVPANGTITIPGSALIDTTTLTPLTAAYGSNAIRFDVFVESSAIKASSVKANEVTAGTVKSNVSTTTVYTNRIQADTTAAGAL